MKKTLPNIIMFFVINSLLFSQTIVNGDFEQGTLNWSPYSAGNYNLISSTETSSEISPTVYPRSGNYMARLGGFSREVNSIKQTITVPKAQNVYLGFYYQTRASSTSECGGLWVGAHIRVYIDGKVAEEEYLCNYNSVNEWTYVYYDLSAYADKTIEFGFRADAANSVWSFLYIDDVSITTTVDVPENENRELTYQLNQNYPNPFNPETSIQYAIGSPANGTSMQFVTLKVYDVLGKEVATLVNEDKAPGNYEVKFNGSNLASGMYFYRLQAGDYVEFKKMTILK